MPDLPNAVDVLAMKAAGEIPPEANQDVAKPDAATPVPEIGADAAGKPDTAKTQEPEKEGGTPPPDTAKDADADKTAEPPKISDKVTTEIARLHSVIKQKSSANQQLREANVALQQKLTDSSPVNKNADDDDDDAIDPRIAELQQSVQFLTSHILQNDSASVTSRLQQIEAEEEAELTALRSTVITGISEGCEDLLPTGLPAEQLKLQHKVLEALTRQAFLDLDPDEKLSDMELLTPENVDIAYVNVRALYQVAAAHAGIRQIANNKKAAELTKVKPGGATGSPAARTFDDMTEQEQIRVMDEWTRKRQQPAAA